MERVQGVAWDDLAVLLAVLEEGSLNRAARALGTGQSTASRRLARLEERLGSPLFDRTPEGLRPTALAMELAPHAERVGGHMSDIDRLIEGREREPSGRVRLAVVEGLAAHFVVPALPRLRAAHPGIELDLLSGQPVLDLVRREADLALRFVPPECPDLVVRKLRSIPVAPYVHPDLADTAADALPWVMFWDPDESFAESRWLRDHVRPRHVTRVTLWHDLFAAVRLGVGAGLISPLAADVAGLVPVPAFAGEEVVSHPLLLVYHRALRHVPRVKAVRDWILDIADVHQGKASPYTEV